MAPNAAATTVYAEPEAEGVVNFFETNESRSNFPRFWAALSLFMIAGTWRLWFPSIESDAYPALALLPWMAGLPSWLLPATSAWVVFALLAAVIGIRQWCWWLVAIGLMASFLLDQQRLQPWAYQLAIYALIFATLDQRQLGRWLIPMAASVYIYSALGKFDYQFVHTIGQDFLNTIASVVGGLPESFDEPIRAKLALAFPATELIAGVGWLFRRTRRIGGVVVMVMHATLIAVLGPWGLNHSNGVLIWNAALIFQAYWWMVRPQEQKPEPDVKSEPIAPSFAAPLAKLIVAIALLAPLTERWGIWDHWLSWSLYSPHTSRVDVQIHQSAVSRLPERMAAYVDSDLDNDGWQTFSLEAWSLGSRGVPVVPQARYQLSLAIELARQQDWSDDIRARLRSVSDRVTGARHETLLLGRNAMETELSRFWLAR